MSYHDILRFDVSVENFMPMHQRNGIEETADDKRRALLAQDCPGRHNVIELAVGAKFKQGIEVLFIREESIAFDDVGVVEERLNLYLPDELAQQILLNNLTLVHDLQGDSEVSIHLPCQINGPEPALS
jgi:hypothetical protein